MEKEHVFKVEMSCDGCVNTISKVLNKHKDQGIITFDVNLGEKIVTILSILPASSLDEILRKTGKQVEYLGEKS